MPITIGGGGGSTIDKLSDVADVSSTPVATEGQVLVRSAGDEWVPTTQVLSNNSDVSATAATDGQVLTMVGSQWTPADGVGNSLSQLSDCFGSEYPTTLATQSDWDVSDATWDGNTCSASNWFGLLYQPWMAFDGDPGSSWRTTFGRYGYVPNLVPSTSQTTTTDQGDVIGDWLQIELPSAVVLKAYKLIIRQHESEGERQVPLEWAIVGRVGATGDWSMVDNRDDMNLNPSYIEWGLTAYTRYFRASNNTAYKQYRFIVLRVGLDAAALAEWKLYTAMPSAGVEAGSHLVFDGEKWNANTLEDTHVVASNAQMYSTIAASLYPLATTQTVDFNTGNLQVLDLVSATGDVTLTLTNGAAGASYIILIRQRSVARNVVWPASVKWAGGTTPVITQAANSVDIVSLIYDGTDYFASIVQDLS